MLEQRHAVYLCGGPMGGRVIEVAALTTDIRVEQFVRLGRRVYRQALNYRLAPGTIEPMAVFASEDRLIPDRDPLPAWSGT